MSCARFTFRWLHQTSMWCNFAFMLITTFGSSVILKLSPISYLGFVLSSFIQFGCEEKLIVRLVKLPKIETPNTKRTMKKWAASFASVHCAQCHHHDLKTLSWSPAACKTPPHHFTLSFTSSPTLLLRTYLLHFAVWKRKIDFQAIYFRFAFCHLINVTLYYAVTSPLHLKIENIYLTSGKVVPRASNGESECVCVWLSETLASSKISAHHIFS